jgi:hypothetical protein
MRLAAACRGVPMSHDPCNPLPSSVIPTGLALRPHQSAMPQHGPSKPGLRDGHAITALAPTYLGCDHTGNPRAARHHDRGGNTAEALSGNSKCCHHPARRGAITNARTFQYHHVPVCDHPRLVRPPPGYLLLESPAPFCGGNCTGGKTPPSPSFKIRSLLPGLSALTTGVQDCSVPHHSVKMEADRFILY